jgi:CheY-like chemotaxis protein
VAPVAWHEQLDGDFAKRYPLEILLVEDDAVNLKLMRMMLRKFGYEPLVAADGCEAVDVYCRERPGCVLMDLQMPRKDGLQACREIRVAEQDGVGRPAFIAALTANIVAETRRQCFEAGMDAYMNKPVRRTVLAETLAEASRRTHTA